MSSASASPLLLDCGKNLHLHGTDDTDDVAPVVTTRLDTNASSPQVVPETGSDGESHSPPIVQEAWPGTLTIS